MEKILSKVITEKQVNVNEFSVKKALRWLHRLQRVFGPAMAGFLTQGQEVNSNSIQAAFAAMNEQMNEQQYNDWILDLLEGVVVENVPVSKENIDLFFKGKLLFLHKVLWFVLEVNFSDFLEELKAKKEIQDTKPIAMRQG